MFCWPLSLTITLCLSCYCLLCRVIPKTLMPREVCLLQPGEKSLTPFFFHILSVYSIPTDYIFLVLCYSFSDISTISLFGRSNLQFSVKICFFLVNAFLGWSFFFSRIYHWNIHLNLMYLHPLFLSVSLLQINLFFFQKIISLVI